VESIPPINWTKSWELIGKYDHLQVEQERSERKGITNASWYDNAEIIHWEIQV
jgi:hypothetical protein